MMNTTLAIELLDSYHYKFIVTFRNDMNTSTSIPIGKLKNSAERVGLSIESNGDILEPVSFSIPKINNDAIIDLKPGETASIVLSANIEKLGKSAWGLVFNRATYVIELQKQYKIWFSLEEYKSNVVTLSFFSK